MNNSDSDPVKVNGYIFWGSNSARFNFVSLLKSGEFLEERICSLRSGFFP